MRRLQVVPGGLLETRMTTLGHCGLRSCLECETAARGYRAARAEGPWSHLTTLTLDHPKITLRRAWAKLPKWVGMFIRAMQRQADLEEGSRLEVNNLTPIVRGTAYLSQVGRVRAVPKVLYAWAIEPHKSGMPHVHIAHSCRWLDYTWARKTWARITGMRRTNPDHEQLKDNSPTNRYLTKYITKGHLPLDLCAITRRKRLFWSAMPLQWEPPAGWLRVARDTVDVARSVLEGVRDNTGQDGWVDSATPSAEHMIQVREWRDDRIHPESSCLVPVYAPAAFDATPGEFASMYVAARAQADSLWWWRWWHESGEWMTDELRQVTLVTIAWAMTHGMSFRYKAKRWRPIGPPAPLHLVSAATAYPRCAFCLP